MASPRSCKLPVGAGETPIVGLASAVANALFHWNGRRLRALPLEM